MVLWLIPVVAYTLTALGGAGVGVAVYHRLSPAGGVSQDVNTHIQRVVNDMQPRALYDFCDRHINIRQSEDGHYISFFEYLGIPQSFDSSELSSTLVSQLVNQKKVSLLNEPNGLSQCLDDLTEKINEVFALFSQTRNAGMPDAVPVDPQTVLSCQPKHVLRASHIYLDLAYIQSVLQDPDSRQRYKARAEVFRPRHAGLHSLTKAQEELERAQNGNAGKTTIGARKDSVNQMRETFADIQSKTDGILQAACAEILDKNRM